MLGKQDKSLSGRDIADLLEFAECGRQPLRNRVLVVLSTKAGVRAGEIAGLTWDKLLDANGQISSAHRAVGCRREEWQWSAAFAAPGAGRSPVGCLGLAPDPSR